MKLNRDRIVAIGFFVLSIFVLIFAQNIAIPPNLSEPGPRIFPQIAGLGMLVCSVGMFFTTKIEDEKPFLDKEGWKRLGLIFVMLILYLIALMYVGFLISTFVFLFLFINVLKNGKDAKLVTILAVTIITTILLYLAFTKGFAIALPKGKIF